MNKDLRSLFVEELSDILSAEAQIIKAVPKMIRHVQSKDPRTAFENHLEQICIHVERLKEIEKILGSK